MTTHCVPTSVTTDCCSRLSASITPVAQYNDGTLCCFTLWTNVGDVSECGGGVNKVVILNSSGDSIWVSSGNSVRKGVALNQVCIESPIFNPPAPIVLNISFVNYDGHAICTIPATVYPCQNPPTPCTPDCDSITWIKGIDSTVYNCNGTNCSVTFTFYYRVSNCSSVHYNDVQVTEYWSSCASSNTCPNNMVDAITTTIWNNSNVQNYFGVDGMIGNDTCYYDYRLITSDCWTIVANNGGGVIGEVCPGQTCCYGVYKVCYHRENIYPFPIQLVTTPPNEPQKISSTYDPERCTWFPLCSPNNCNLWCPSDVNVSNPNKISIYPNNSDTTNFTGNEICNIEITQGLELTNLNLNVNCPDNGQLSLHIYNLLGDLVSEYNFDKDNKVLIKTLSLNLETGSYFCIVNLNNLNLYYKQIIIVK
jgi:hypothetical protein